MEPRYAGRRVLVAPALTGGVVWRRVLLGALLCLALAVRLREALASPIIGAEDPYLHMARTYDLLDGYLPRGYPPGFTILLVPFAILGPDAFVFIARFLPPLLGVVEVLGMYLLCRENLRAPAAFVAATAVALMPENVLRTDLLFPTALDLALLPFFFLHLLRAARGFRWSLAWCAGIALLLAFAHPWALAFMLPPTFGVALVSLTRARDRYLALGALGVVAVAGVAFAFVPGTWNPAPAFFQHAGPRALELLLHPSTLFPLPRYVDSFPGMISRGVLALAVVGAFAAVVRRTTIGMMALVFTLAILPFVFVDWFDVWFIPHRSVAYMSLGLAILAALPVELMGALPEWNMGDIAAGFVIVAYMLAVMTPVAFDVGPWYRMYDEKDYDAWHAVADRGTPLIITGSWQGAVGYRAVTGKDAIFDPPFFTSARARSDAVDGHPGMVLLVDNYARENGFKAPAGWKEIGRWGDNVAYTPSR